MSKMNIIVWNEFLHERSRDDVRAIYPDGIHSVIAGALRQQLAGEAQISTATLDQTEHGLTADRLAETDVLFWWGHMAHDKVDDAIAERVHRRVLEGMGLVVLHSAHACKVFLRLMGTGCMLRWREEPELERIWVIDPAHPIARSVSEPWFELPQTEMYGEVFDVPTPDELIFISWFEGGEVFRSGMTWRRGAGRVFYFRPGHETYPIYHDERVQRILADAARWAARREIYPSQLGWTAQARHITEPVHPPRDQRSDRQ